MRHPPWLCKIEEKEGVIIKEDKRTALVLIGLPLGVYV